MNHPKRLCRVTLNPLSKREINQNFGYSRAGLKQLMGNARSDPQLPFTRSDFIHDLPKTQKGMSISGYQPKLQMTLHDNRFVVVDCKGSHILKPSPEDFPYLAENEHATMTLMARLGFSVPPHGLVPFSLAADEANQEYAFVIKRYDRDDEGNSLHQEQLDAAMGIAEKFGKIKDDGEGYVSYEQLALFLIENVNDNIKFKVDLFRRVIYSYLLGNNDLHLRNFGLILPRLGVPQLSPVYDFVSVAPYKAYLASCYLALPLLVMEEGNAALAPGFDTEYGEYLGMDFLLLGKGIGLSEKLIKKLISELQNESSLVQQTYSNSFMPSDHINEVLKNYNHRLKVISVLDAASLS